jgi:polyhydroxyalkanoate synthesis repressor PhaR
MKVYKRYSNRKLYDTVQSRYVTLKDIEFDSKNGVEFLVVDNESKRDLTKETLMAVIFKYADIDETTLHELIYAYSVGYK